VRQDEISNFFSVHAQQKTLSLKENEMEVKKIGI
jgi:hypothetical protein